MSQKNTIDGHGESGGVYLGSCSEVQNRTTQHHDHNRRNILRNEH
jgi:predicted GIY-YIG superfamily endonuclease